MQPHEPDLNHVERQILNHQAAIDEARREAQTQRLTADQRRDDGAMNGPDYYEQEADRLEQHAIDLENELAQLRADKERFEKRIAQLEEQKAQLSTDSADQRARIDNELAKLRGSSLIL